MKLGIPPSPLDGHSALLWTESLAESISLVILSVYKRPKWIKDHFAYAFFVKTRGAHFLTEIKSKRTWLVFSSIPQTASN